MFCSRQIVHDALARVHVPQDADFPLRTVAFSFHELGPFCWTQAEPSSGSNFWNHVTVQDLSINIQSLMVGTGTGCYYLSFDRPRQSGAQTQMQFI